MVSRYTSSYGIQVYIELRYPGNLELWYPGNLELWYPGISITMVSRYTKNSGIQVYIEIWYPGIHTYIILIQSRYT